MRPLAVYVHWPFCLSKCPYCDFNSHVRTAIDYDRWQRAYLAEIESTIAELDDDYQVETVFFGGGTPSTMPEILVADILSVLKERLQCDPDWEVTLEANPAASDRERFQAFAKSGVNRLSLGVQSLRPDRLQLLGRNHRVYEAKTALEAAVGCFERVSFDLIYGTAQQSLVDWQRELEEALELRDQLPGGGHSVQHLSCYQLTIEPGTHFYSRTEKGEQLTQHPDLLADFYSLTHEILYTAGLPGYEVSNFAANGQESRHNLSYWRYQSFLGLGPGAHGRIVSKDDYAATQRVRLPEKWLESIEAKGGSGGLATRTRLASDDVFAEIVLMGLRLKEGLPESRLITHTGKGFDGLDVEALDLFQKQGWLDITTQQDSERWLHLSKDGRLRLDGITQRLL